MLTKKVPATTTYYLIRAAYGFFFGGIGVASTVYRVEVAGLNPLQLVLVGTVLEAAYFSAEIPTGIVADMYSRKWSTIIGYLLIGLGFMVEGAFAIFGIILVAQVIWVVGATFTSGAEEAWLADEIGAHRLTDVFLRASQVARVASILGTLVGMVLGSVSLSLTMFLSGAGISVIGLFLIFLMQETGFTPTPRHERNTWQTMGDTFREGFRHVRASHMLLLIFAIELSFGLSSEGIDRLGDAHLIESFTLPTIVALQPVVWLGIANITIRVLGIGFTEWIRRRVDEEDRLQTIRYQRILNIAFLVSILLFAFATNFIFALVISITLSLFRGAGNPLFGAWLNREITEPQVRATVLSMFGQINAIGQIVGGPLIGALATATTIGSGFLGVAALLLPVPLLLTLALRWTRERVEKSALEKADATFGA
jgi:DHA3 family tetracycline resistance protein-like MFS transporter